jgi:hypothetical protein
MHASRYSKLYLKLSQQQANHKGSCVVAYACYTMLDAFQKHLAGSSSFWKLPLGKTRQHNGQTATEAFMYPYNFCVINIGQDVEQ